MSSLDPKKLDRAIKYIDTWFDINFNQGYFAGLQVAILHEDKIMYSKAFGYADIENKVELTPQHVMRVASHTKSITATAIMQLVEAGKLNLDDKVSAHIDWFTSTKDERVAHITIRQLLNHSSGLIRDGEDSDFWQQLRPFPDETELRAYISTAALVFNSDEQFKYSNFGYGYLGFVITAVSGASYLDYIQENSIKKLGLEHTTPDSDTVSAGQLATGYGPYFPGKDHRKLEHSTANALTAATGLCSTAEDLCRFYASHFFGNTTLISDYAKRHMHHGYWSGERESAYGLGMEEVYLQGWDIRGHGGGYPGFKSATVFDPKKKFALSLIVNDDWAKPKGIIQSILDIINLFQQSSDDTAKTAKFEGRFCTSDFGLMDIISTGEKLVAFGPRGWWGPKNGDTLTVKDDSTLIIETRDGFAHPGEMVEYSFNDDGSVASLRYGGMTRVPYEEAVKRGWLEHGPTT